MSRKNTVALIEPGIRHILQDVGATPREVVIALRNAAFDRDDWPEWTVALSHFIELTADLDPGFD